MDSFATIEQSFKKIQNNPILDHDSKITHRFEILKAFARDILKISDNIEETSIHYGHKVERIETLLNHITK